MAAAMVAVATATAFGPHVSIVFVGVIAAAWSGYFLLRPRVGRPYPVTPVLTLLLLPTYWLLATIAGPEGLRIDALQRVPLSPAAEWLIAPALLLVGWSVAGLWPLHRWTPGALLAPLGALLLVRIGFPLVPGGVDDWRPVAIPLLILGTWHAAWSAGWASAAAGAGLLGLAGHTPVGAAGAVWLLGSAFLLELCSSAPLPARLWEVVRVASWAASAWGGLLVLEGGLRSEVVYTAVGALGLAVVIVARRGQAMIARAPSTPAPSV